MVDLADIVIQGSLACPSSVVTGQLLPPPTVVWTSLSRHDGGNQPEALHPG